MYKATTFITEKYLVIQAYCEGLDAYSGLNGQYENYITKLQKLHKIMTCTPLY